MATTILNVPGFIAAIAGPILCYTRAAVSL